MTGEQAQENSMQGDEDIARQQLIAGIGDNKPPLDPIQERAIAVFNPLATQLAAIKKANAEFVFDVNDKKQREAARSHIYKLRQTKAAIEKAGKAERADAIAHQKAVIVEEDKLVAEVIEMIEHHSKPLEEWEQKEATRIETIRKRIDSMQVDAEFVTGKTSDELKVRLAELNSILTTESFDEFADQAYAMKVVALNYLQAAIAAAESREADARELERLRTEAEARRVADELAAEMKRIEDERVAAEKAEAERVAAETAAQAERDAKAQQEREAEAARVEKARLEAVEAERLRVEAEAAERERLLLEQAENARREAEEAESRRVQEAAAAEARRVREAAEAEQRAADERKAADDRQAAAVAAETKRIANEAAKKKAGDDARAADREHRSKINRETLAVLTELLELMGTGNSPEEQAKGIITEIALGKIPHLQINY